MTSRTGTKQRIALSGQRIVNGKGLSAIRYPLFAKKGFTLIEAMIATIILALGTTFLSRSFFITLDSYNYCSRYLQVMSWADEKVWEAQENLSRLGAAASVNNAGSFIEKGRDFKWYLAYSPLNADGSLYKVDFEMSWQEGAREARIKRSTYARYEKKEE